MPFLIQPLSAVFYPVNVLPPWLQPVALLLPSTHVFEGMRAVLAGHASILPQLGWAFALNLVFLAIAALHFARTLNRARDQGTLVKLATH